MIKVVIQNNIKNCIKEYAKRTGIKLNFIADKMGMSQQTLTNQYYAKNPTIANIARFAYAMDLAMHEVVNIHLYDENGNEIYHELHMDINEKKRREKLRMIQMKLNKKRMYKTNSK